MLNCVECKTEFHPKRKEQKYCSRSCADLHRGKSDKRYWTGHRPGWQYKTALDQDGYVRVYARLHPFCDGRLLMLQHQMLMEVQIGRRLHPDECVHHINGDRKDNRLGNLQLMTKSEHSALHGRTSSRPRGKDGRFA